MAQKEDNYNIDWSQLKTLKLKFKPKYIEYIDKKLIEAGLNLPQRVAFISNVIAESGGDPMASGDGGKATGILQWHPGRYARTKEKDPYKELDNQIAYALSTLTEYKKDGVSWNDGGKGTGYMNGEDAFNAWYNTDDALAATRAVSLGYLRPAAHLKAADYRAGIADKVAQFMDPNNIYNSKKEQKALIKDVKKRVDNPLVQSLNDPNRPAIPDHEDSTKKVTHKMGWTTLTSDAGNAVVYPNALNIDGRFVDTTDPKNRYTENDAFNAAVAQKDTLMFPQIQQAAWFAENYKNYFPGFNKYSNGGNLNTAYDLLSKEERNAVIEAAIDSGIVGINNIRNYYNKFTDGGDLNNGNPSEETTESIYQGELTPASTTSYLSRDQWNDLYKKNKVSLTDVPLKYRSWIEGENSDLKKQITEGTNKVASYVLPAVIGVATGGAPGAVAAMTGMAGDAAINVATKGKNNSWGELLVDAATKGKAQEHPWWTLATEFTNPLNFINFGDSHIMKEYQDAIQRRINEDVDFAKYFNKNFAEKYGYTPINKYDAEIPGAVDAAAKDIIDQHHTFTRGVSDYRNSPRFSQEEIDALDRLVSEAGLDPNLESDRILHALIYPTPSNGYGRVNARNGLTNLSEIVSNIKNGKSEIIPKNSKGTVYTSNDFNFGLGYTYKNNPNHVGIVQIPYTLGKNRYDWVKQGEISHLSSRLFDDYLLEPKINNYYSTYYDNLRRTMLKDLNNPNSSYYTEGTKKNRLLREALKKDYADTYANDDKINSYQDFLYKIKGLARNVLSGDYIPKNWEVWTDINSGARTLAPRKVSNTSSKKLGVSPDVKRNLEKILTAPNSKIWDETNSNILPIEALFKAVAAQNIYSTGPKRLSALYVKGINQFENNIKNKSLFDSIDYNNNFRHSIFYGELGKPVLKLRGTMPDFGIDTNDYMNPTRAHHGSPSDGLSLYKTSTENLVDEFDKYLHKKYKKQ